MSSSRDHKKSPDEQKLMTALLRRKVVTDGQVKAAMDYQRSLGGKLSEILVKLGLARASQIEEVTRNPDSTEPVGESPAPAAEHALDPASVRLADLKVHRKLLDKIPPDLGSRYLLVPFFPLPNGDSRKIIMGHGVELPAEIASKVKTILGVEICTLQIEERVARELSGHEERSDTKRSQPVSRSEAASEVARKPEVQEPERAQAATPAPREPANREGLMNEALLEALLTLLVRKGVVSREELEEEVMGVAAARVRG